MPPPPKRTVIAKLPTQQATVLPPDYADHNQKDFAAFIRKVKSVLELDVAVYPTEMDQMLFAKQYLVVDTAAMWD